MSQLLTRVGPSRNSVGAAPPWRSGDDAEGVVLQARGKYGEATRRGGCYAAMVSAATGVAPGTAIGTTAAYVLYNPRGSGVRLYVQRCSLAYLSGTLGAGAWVYVALIDPTLAVPSGGTSITPICTDLGSQSSGQGSKAIPRFNATIASTPNQLRPFASQGAELATTANGLQTATEDVDGEFVIEPGALLGLEFVGAAGTSPLVTIGMSWEECSL